VGIIRSCFVLAGAGEAVTTLDYKALKDYLSK
jgi:hypothetical protein